MTRRGHRFGKLDDHRVGLHRRAREARENGHRVVSNFTRSCFCRESQRREKGAEEQKDAQFRRAGELPLLHRLGEFLLRGLFGFLVLVDVRHARAAFSNGDAKGLWSIFSN